MIRRALLLTSMSFIWAGAAASQETNLLEVWENVCVSQSITPENIRANLDAIANVKNIGLKEVPGAMLEAIAPGTKRGWGIGTQASMVLVAYGEKPSDQGLSHNCVAITTNYLKDDVTAFIEGHYKETKMIDEMQGTSEVVGYRLDLIGFPSPRYTSIQAVKDIGNGQGLTMVSFFDVPN